MADPLLDTDLLQLFEALMAEHSVTRAAHRVGLTQAAASNALRRMRERLGDELFVRTPQGMEPTALARKLAEPIATALASLRAARALSRPFDPAEATAELIVGMSDYAELLLVPPLTTRLRALAPGLSLTVRHADREVAQALLEKDEVQLAVGTLPEPPGHMTRTVLLRDELVVLLRATHPAAGSLDLESFLASPHLLVSAVASREGAVDRALATLGRARRLAIVVSHYLVAGPALRDSDLVATVGWRVALPLAAAFGLAVRPLPAPLTVAPQVTSMSFHNRYAQDPAQRWLRRLIAETARGLHEAPLSERTVLAGLARTGR